MCFNPLVCIFYFLSIFFSWISCCRYSLSILNIWSVLALSASAVSDLLLQTGSWQWSALVLMEPNSSVFCASQNPSSIASCYSGRGAAGSHPLSQPSVDRSLAVRGRFPGPDPDREGEKWAGAGLIIDLWLQPPPAPPYPSSLW